MTPDTALFSATGLGIPIALVGAVFLALGAQFQHAGVAKVDDEDDAARGLNIRQILALVRRPAWLIGTLLSGLAIVFQLTSLTLAPITVVQPLGVVGLIVTSIINSRVAHVPLGLGVIRAISFCVAGVAIFVTIAALTTESKPITTRQLIIVLAILGTVILLFALSLVFLRNHFSPIAYILSGGILFGFVATLAKVVIDRIKTLFQVKFQTGQIEWLTIGCVFLLICAALLGSYFVQSAYANGPPDLVVAGLTVIDPVVAIIIGITVLNEVKPDAPFWAIPAFLVAAALAIYGVFQLAKHHPQLQS